MPPQNYPPPTLLSNLIQTLWYVERDFSPPNSTFQVLPDSRIELIFSFGSPLFSTSNEQLSPSFVVGLLDTAVSLKADGVVRLIGVRFYPWGFHALFGELFNLPLSGIQLAGEPLNELGRQLESRLVQGVPSAIDGLRADLTDQALRASLKEKAFVIAAQQILFEKGTLDLAELADTLFVSPRTLRRKFQAILGKNPKTLARIARFEVVRNSLWANPNSELSDLALVAGYADQAHMQREFRQFAHQTPRQFSQEMRNTRARLDP